ncbi:type II toxin-antitoxin system RelE/ParE family toxin [Chamaesiphon polymorphus]|uniref:type II toxin-antitoxin system RelE/ParE family toxin n=1 Tax=Chamaesiphon polymorphus TaxID=2107691 RepID=UPI001C637B7E|nr:type II toxin-antitoxin system RelE/ParE family toxin [Chamaesiphon polymorphus]
MLPTRAITYGRLRQRWIFVYGFPKNERSNIEKDEEGALKELAEELLSLTPEEIEIIKDEGKLFEVNCNEETEIGDP